MNRNGELHATNKTSWWRGVDNSIEQRKKMVEKKMWKELGKSWKGECKEAIHNENPQQSYQRTKIGRKRAI
jgi:hypothetical protein